MLPHPALGVQRHDEQGGRPAADLLQRAARALLPLPQQGQPGGNIDLRQCKSLLQIVYSFDSASPAETREKEKQVKAPLLEVTEKLQGVITFGDGMTLTGHPLQLVLGIFAVLPLVSRAGGQEDDLHVILHQGDVVPAVLMVNVEQLLHLAQRLPGVGLRTEEFSDEYYDVLGLERPQ